MVPETRAASQKSQNGTLINTGTLNRDIEPGRRISNQFTLTAHPCIVHNGSNHRFIPPNIQKELQP
jgi:hypothetical protein